LQRGVGEFIVDLSQCPRPKVLHLVRVMFHDGRLERGYGLRTDLLSEGGLSFNIGNLYLEPIINEDCRIMGFLKSILRILPAQTGDHSFEARNSSTPLRVQSPRFVAGRYRSGTPKNVWNYISIMISRFNDHSRKKSQSHRRDSIESTFPFFDNSVRL
jgi:hypothetical protein